MEIDTVLLSTIYTGRLLELRLRAEECGLSKTGSVEVLRARLISKEVLPNADLSWDGIQSMSNKGVAEVLKIFGIKSSGSHKERRQRLWLHLNYDSRRLTIELLAEMGRDELHKLCKKLELDLTGNRTVLMGRVAGVLTNQLNGWGRIKRSLRRNGIPAMIETPESSEADSESHENPPEDANFQSLPSKALLEDASDELASGIESQSISVQGDILTIQARIPDLERMVGTILERNGGYWGHDQIQLLLRLAERRGWPLSSNFVRDRVISVSNNIAEVKGASTEFEVAREKHPEGARSTIKRIRKKLSSIDEILPED